MNTELPSRQRAIKSRCYHPCKAFFEFRDEEVEQSIPARFEQQVINYPDRIAIIKDNHKLTYSTLNRAVNRAARLIGKQYGNVDQPIALLLGNEISMIVSILAVLKLGKIFVPIDPQYPISKIIHMVEDAQAGLIVTNDKYYSLTHNLAEDKYSLINIDENQSHFSSENLKKSISPESIAYIVYTSGTTGQPKGIVHSHQNLLHTTLNYTNAFHICYEDRLILLHSCGFSAGICDIFSSLLNGASLCLWDVKEQGFVDLPHQLVHEQITYFHWIPTPFRHFTEILTGKEKFPHLRLIILGSETLLKKDIELYKKHFSSNCIFVNRLGTSETTIFRTYFINQEIQVYDNVPVGYSVENKEVLILDENKNEVGYGSIGEIAVRSKYVAVGYWRKPELTSACFLTDSNNSQKKIYLTGDLGRLQPDGCLEHHGRKDFQIKIRGHRVEIDEIEIALKVHEAVKDVVVVGGDDKRGEKSLKAYVVPNPGKSLKLNALYHFLNEKLPKHAIPSALVILDSLPLTPTGKVDRQALTESYQSRSRPEATCVAPRTEAEAVLARIWSDVLGGDQIGIDDNFFELGGDSILCFQIVARANQCGIQITPQQLLEHPTIQTLSAVAGKDANIQAEQGIVTGSLPQTPIFYWFWEQNIPNPHHYNQAVMLEVRQSVDHTLLVRAIQHLQSHHDVLRLRCVQSEEKNHAFIVEPEEDLSFLHVDCSALADMAKEYSAKGIFLQNMVTSAAKLPEPIQYRMIDTVSAELQGSLNFINGPLVRVAFFDFGPDNSGRLFICIHHFAMDGISWRILLEDLQTAYQQLHIGKSIQLPLKTTSFKQWARRLSVYAQSGALREELSYWLAEPFKHDSSLPVDLPAAREENTVDSGRGLSKSLTIEETQVLLREAPKFYQTRINELLLMVLVRTFAPWTGRRSLLVDLEGHGREDIGVPVDLSRTIGWFTVVFPVFLNLDSANTTDETLRSIKEQLGKVPNNGIGYGLLRFLSADTEVTESLRKLPQAEVRFNYLGQFDQPLSGSSFFRLTRESCGPCRDSQGMRRYLIDVFGSIVEGQLHIDWTFSANAHQRATIEELAERFIEELRLLIAQCRSLEKIRYTPSDFELASLDQQQLDSLINRLGNVEEQAFEK